jgi:hypothetical protein
MTGFEFLAMGMAMAGTAVKAYGDIQAGQNAANVAEHNAEVERMQGTAQFANASRNVWQQQLDFQSKVSQSKAAIAHQGGSFTGASDVLAPMYLRNAYNSNLQATEGENREQYAWDKANVMDIGAQAAREGGYLNAFGTILTGAAKISHAQSTGASGSQEPFGYDEDNYFWGT